MAKKRKKRPLDKFDRLMWEHIQFQRLPKIIIYGRKILFEHYKSGGIDAAEANLTLMLN